MAEKISRFSLAAVLLLFALVSFYRIGAGHLFDVDEAVFSEATKEMVLSGDWIIPTYNGANRYDKPILIYWLMAVSYKTFGINEFGARFPSALSAFLLSAYMLWFIRRTCDEKTAVWATLSFVLSLYFAIYSHAAITDMVLTLFMTLSLASFYLSVSTDSDKRRVLLYSFYLFSALAFLTKGLIGIVFPFGIAFLYMMAIEGKSGLRKIFSLPGLIIFLLVSAPWYIAAYMINGNEFIQMFFIKHHFKRFTGVISGHSGPFYYYVFVLLLGLFPWAPFLLPATVRTVRGYRNRMSVQLDAPQKPAHSLMLFAFIWFYMIFIFFSLATTKLPNYILSSIPAACILIGYGISENGKGWLRFAGGLTAIISAALALAAFTAPRYLLKLNFADTGWMNYISFVGVLIFAAAVFGIIRQKIFLRYWAVLAFSFLALVYLFALPAANEYLQGPLYRLSVYAGEHMEKNDFLAVHKLNMPSIVFYSGRFVTRTDSAKELAALSDKAAKILVIGRSKDMELIGSAGFTLLNRDGDYAIFEKK